MAREQGSQPGAKADTAYHATAGAGIAVDLSQELTNLTASGAGAYELPSTRSSRTSERTVFVRWEANALDPGAVLLIHGDAALTNYSFSVTVGIGLDVDGVQNGVVVWASAPVTAGKEYGVSWSIRPNPDTTGAGDALISEYVIWNYTDAVTFEVGQTTHAVPVTNAAWGLTIGGWWNGAALLFVPQNAPTVVRVSHAHHPTTEVFSDWFASRPAHVGADDAPSEPIGPIPIGSGMGDAGYFAGRHPWGHAAAHSRQAARRSWSLLVNDVYTDAQVVGAEPFNWCREAPGAPTFKMCLQWLRWVPVPAEATHAWVRVHVETVDAGDRSLRVYAMNRPPDMTQIGAEPAPALEAHHASVTWAAPVGSAEGWHELGLVKLPRFGDPVSGWTGTVHLCLAYLGAMPGTTTITAWHARPAHRFTPGGFDD